MKFLAALIIILISLKSFGQGKGEIIYKYKKFQEFDMEDLSITGESGALGDLSSDSRFQRAFKNKLPLRKNFNPELRRSVEVIR